jgi:uncharacterized membrane protein (UPF0182 family)
MPQLKKVVLAMGDRLIYRDTFEEALADLTGAPAPAAPPASVSASAPAPATNTKTGPTLADQLRTLREQSEQLTRELQKLEQEAGKK